MTTFRIRGFQGPFRLDSDGNPVPPIIFTIDAYVHFHEVLKSAALTEPPTAHNPQFLATAYVSEWAERFGKDPGSTKSQQSQARRIADHVIASLQGAPDPRGTMFDGARPRNNGGIIQRYVDGSFHDMVRTLPI